MALIHGKVSIDKLANEFDKSNLNSDSDKKEIDKIKFEFIKSINFKNVSFNYPGRDNALNKINLEIPKNTITGIKGDTGSGKSTLIKLIMNLLEPSSGEIFVDEKPLNSIKNGWQKKIGYIPQNFYILDDTILENIVFSQQKSDFDYKKISEILKFSKLDKLINSLPEGLNTIVGPSGKLLSGGQAQRLAIARALYQEKDILIFDEATNALDEDTENEILKNISKLSSSKTVIIVSHSKKVLDICNQILTIKEKQLI